jgi:hypothetical protein
MGIRVKMKAEDQNRKTYVNYFENRKSVLCRPFTGKSASDNILSADILKIPRKTAEGLE